MKKLPTNLPKIGQGIMRFENIYSKEGILKYQEIIDYLMSEKVNYFEAATFYLNNHCENLLRHLLRKYKREEYFLADKIDPREFLNKKNINYEDFFLNFFNNQLKKLNTEYFDFYLLQALDRDCVEILTKNNIYDIINILKEENKIHYIGFSFHDSPEYLEYFLDQYDWDFVQIQLNYYNYYNGVSKQLYDIATQRGIPVFVMGSTQGGLLSKLPLENKEEIKDFPFESAIAINFLKKLDNVRLVLNGTNNLIETKQNLSFWKKEIINFDERNIIKKINQKEYINCTGCGYCEQVCDKVKIKELFTLYNKIIQGDKTVQKEYLDLYKAKYGPYACIKCGKCEKRCPQKISIREKIDFLIMKFRA